MDFKGQLTDKFSKHFDELMKNLRDIDYDNALSTSIKDINHIRAVMRYTDTIATKTEANLMDLYSNIILSVNKHDSYSEKKLLETADDLLDHNKLLFQKGIASCFDSLMKNGAGRIYSSDTLKKCIAVNCATKLQISQDEFIKWAEGIKLANKEQTSEKENDAAKA